jgi:hypothetical protein
VIHTTLKKSIKCFFSQTSHSSIISDEYEGKQKIIKYWFTWNMSLTYRIYDEYHRSKWSRVRFLKISVESSGVKEERRINRVESSGIFFHPFRSMITTRDKPSNGFF